MYVYGQDIIHICTCLHPYLLVKIDLMPYDPRPPRSSSRGIPGRFWAAVWELEISTNKGSFRVCGLGVIYRGYIEALL